MNDGSHKVVEAEDLADPSLGPASFGFIRDGIKKRLSQKFVNSIFVLVAIVATITTFLSSKEDTEIEKSPFMNIDPTSATTTVVPPAMYDEVRESGDLTKSQGQKSKSKPPEGLKIISLTSLKSIPTGTEARAILVSGASNGPVKARLSESVRLDGDTLIESGSILYGVGQSTEERLFISFNKLIRPSGAEVKIKAEAFDLSDKIIGLKGSKVSSQATKIALSTGLSFVSGYVEGLKEPEPFLMGSGGGRRSPKDAAMDGAATAAADQSKSLMDSIKNSPVIIEVKENSPIWVVFGEGDKN